MNKAMNVALDSNKLADYERSGKMVAQKDKQPV